jgi:hypothetical protein
MKNDKIKTIVVILITGLLIFAVTRDFFLSFADQYKYLGGFVKFMFLASLGDVIGKRIKTKEWSLPTGFIYKALIWGVIGILVVMMFGLFDQGVWFLQDNDLLPNTDIVIVHAILVSTIMNITFGPMMMAFHRVTDTFIDLRCSGEKVSLKDSIYTVDWNNFISFVVLKTIPFFWIPAHTITFILPSEYRVIFAALLGIVLGLLLGMVQGGKQDE